MENINYVEEILNYQFKNKNILIQAFTRSSYKKDGYLDSELLEFFGDEIIGRIAVKIIREKLITLSEMGITSSLKEGELTYLKSKIVENDYLASRCEIFQFEKWLVMAKNDNIVSSYKSDLIESIVGAIAFDCDFDEEILYRVVELLLDPVAVILKSG